MYRQERTDNLDDALQNVSRQLDQMEQACHDVGKKISGCLRTKGMEGDKRFVSVLRFIERFANLNLVLKVKLSEQWAVLLSAKVAGVACRADNDFYVEINATPFRVSPIGTFG